MCREEGRAIDDLSKAGQLDGFGIFGIVKEVGVDDEGERIIFSLLVINLTLQLIPLPRLSF